MKCTQLCDYYLNRIEFKKQIHGSARKSLRIDMGIIRNRGFESVESRFDTGELFELAESSRSADQERPEMGLDGSGGGGAESEGRCGVSRIVEVAMAAEEGGLEGSDAAEEGGDGGLGLLLWLVVVELKQVWVFLVGWRWVMWGLLVVLVLVVEFEDLGVIRSVEIGRVVVVGLRRRVLDLGI